MKDQYDLIYETHGMVKELKGRLDSLNCARNEKEMENIKKAHQALDKRVTALPGRAWFLISGILMLLLTGIGVFSSIMKG